MPPSPPDESPPPSSLMPPPPGRSLWTRDIEAEILPVCRELGIKVVAYSPLGRGFLTGTIRSREALGPQDFRLFGQPRFSEENLPRNLALVDAVEGLAKRKGCTVGQLALAWLHAQVGTHVEELQNIT